ncbi:MAG: DNA polymerase III subunit beta [Lactobacillaceae bacterium]|jgi:DNA polymerase-3 subunit beta|nr:DNA polymerase III subunit beta [Lactobacillaceae bacterium]
MKFSINKSEFVKRIEINNKAISGATLNDVLKGLKITLLDGEMTIVSASTELSIKTTTRKDEKNNLAILEEGEIIVANAAYFTDILKRLSGTMVDFEVVNGNQIKISGGQAEFFIPARNAANFPNLPVIDDTKIMTISSPQLLNVIKETIKSAGIKDTRPIFQGLHFLISEHELKGIATDSHRLAQKIIPIENGADVDAVVPYRTLNELASMLPTLPFVKLQFDEVYLVTDMEDVIFYTQLIVGDFPNTDRLIPEEYITTVTVDVADLMPVVERAHLAAKQSNNVVITWNMKDGDLTITTRQTEAGSFKEGVQLKTFEGENLTISMNPEFIKDAVNSLGQDIVEIGFTGNLRPFTIKPVGEKDNNNLQLITPVRTINS